MITSDKRKSTKLNQKQKTSSDRASQITFNVGQLNETLDREQLMHQITKICTNKQEKHTSTSTSHKFRSYNTSDQKDHKSKLKDECISESESKRTEIQDSESLP
uniref:Uncharacterized protein n=1 Tax=Opuntia streptacantha TaxID=393608 RepID=A0A7C8ZH11_OPUST